MLTQAIVVLSTFAIGTPAEIDPQAQQILDAAVKASEGVNSIRYTIEQRGIGEHAADYAVVTGTMIQQRADVVDAGHGGGKYLATGEVVRPDGTKVPFAWCYDGLTLRVLDPQEKIIAIVDHPDMGDAGRMIGFETGLLPIGQFINGEAWRQLAERADSIKTAPAAEVRGVKCESIIVKQTFTRPDGVKSSGESRWWFSSQDHLPRAFESGSIRKEVTRIELNPELAAADFSLAAPEGFQEKRVLAHAADSRGLLEKGVQAPAFTLKSPEDRAVSLEDLRGKIVVLDFWATWCGPCKKAMPGIQHLREKFPDKDVAIFGVSCSEKPDGDPAAYMKSKSYTYGLLLKGEQITPAYKAQMLPTIYVLDKDGKVLHAEKGYREGAEEEMTQIIEKALGR